MYTFVCIVWLTYSNIVRYTSIYRSTYDSCGKGRGRKNVCVCAYANRWKQKFIWKMNGTAVCIVWRQHWKFYVDFARTCCDLLSRHFFSSSFGYFLLFFTLVYCCSLVPIHHECKWICIIHADKRALQPSNTPYVSYDLHFIFHSPFQPLHSVNPQQSLSHACSVHTWNVPMYAITDNCFAQLSLSPNYDMVAMK